MIEFYDWWAHLDVVKPLDPEEVKVLVKKYIEEMQSVTIVDRMCECV